MSSQGAIQIDVTINNKSLTITKDHVMSLKVKRVIGDSANEFTLEAFDETAFALESALMNHKLAPISVRYSAANDMSKSIIFSGTCLNYQLSFVGRASVITITGILSSSSGDSTGYWFGTQAIEWVGDIEDWASQSEQDLGIHDWHVDGKGWDEIINYENNEDVCAIYSFPLDKDGKVLSNVTPIVYYNPTRIFKRIIKKYNGEIGPYRAGIDMDTGLPISQVSNAPDTVSWSLEDYGAGTFVIGDTDESRWIEGVRRCQESNETAAQYITNVLCKYAISDTGVAYEEETAGFKYYVQNGKHCFKKLNYGEAVSNSNVIQVTYGMQDSNVISFSVSNIGIVAMTGGVSEDGSIVIDESAMDYLYTDEINAKGTNVLGVASNNTDESNMSNDNRNKYVNWYFGLIKGVSVNSTMSQTGITANVNDMWKALQDLTYSADLTIWADYSNKFVPGDYIDLVVTGAGGVRHYSSGTYMIISIDDNISSAGYTQSMKLLKNTTTTKTIDGAGSNSEIILYNYDGRTSVHSASMIDSTSSVSAISSLNNTSENINWDLSIEVGAGGIKTFKTEEDKHKAYLDEIAYLNEACEKEKNEYTKWWYDNTEPPKEGFDYSDEQYIQLANDLDEINKKYESEKEKVKIKYGY